VADPVSVSSVSFHCVINEASLCGALQEAASNSAFRRENIADVFDGFSFVRVELEGRQRGDIPTHDCPFRVKKALEDEL
jgi:hypothetical protein